MIAHLIRRVGCVGRPRWAVLCFYLTLIKTELGNPSSTLKKSTVLTHTTLVAVDNMKISSIGTSSLSLTLPVVVLFIATFTGQMKKNVITIMMYCFWSRVFVICQQRDGKQALY